MSHTHARPHWEICPDCEGNGASSAYLGAYTHDEFMEMDDEWREDYMAGAFDRACPRCRGAGKIDVNSEREQARADLEADPAWQSERHLREIGA